MVPDSETLDKVVRGIVDLVHPLRIVLFGSAVRGEMTSDSDLDVLVVVPDGMHRRRTAQMLYRRMPSVGVPVEFIVATTADLEKHKNNVGLIYRQVLKEGREIYAA